MVDTESIREQLKGIIGEVLAQLEQVPEWDGKDGMRAALEEMRRIAETIQPPE